MPTLESKITAVTVYPDRARVTRAGRATLDAGAQTLTLAGLPIQMDESSVRAAGKGSARLTGIQTSRILAAEANAGPAKAAQDKLQALMDQARALADEQDALNVQLNLIK